MAKCTIKKARIAVTLELTEEEARTLKTVCALIGGSPDESLRKYMDSIDVALSNKDIRGYPSGCYQENSDIFFYNGKWDDK